MSKFLRPLLVAAAFLTLAPTAALADPYFCYQICNQTVPCNMLCHFGPEVITCGEYSICGDARHEPSDVTASASQDETRQSDAGAQVCEEVQATKLSAPSES